MSASLVGFLVRCAVIIVASTVLVLALMEAGTASESAGACASNPNHYAQVNWLQTAVRPLAAFARFCD
jgi:hypothetical protein